MKYTIKETYEIIKGFRTSTYTVEANSEDDAIDMINNGEVDADSEEDQIENTEFLHRVIEGR